MQTGDVALEFRLKSLNFLKKSPKILGLERALETLLNTSEVLNDQLRSEVHSILQYSAMQFDRFCLVQWLYVRRRLHAVRRAIGFALQNVDAMDKRNGKLCGYMDICRFVG